MTIRERGRRGEKGIDTEMKWRIKTERERERDGAPKSSKQTRGYLVLTFA